VFAWEETLELRKGMCELPAAIALQECVRQCQTVSDSVRQCQTVSDSVIRGAKERTLRDTERHEWGHEGHEGHEGGHEGHEGRCTL
jgi:hypothetical protein